MGTIHSILTEEEAKKKCFFKIKLAVSHENVSRLCFKYCFWFFLNNRCECPPYDRSLELRLSVVHNVLEDSPQRDWDGQKDKNSCDEPGFTVSPNLQKKKKKRKPVPTVLPTWTRARVGRQLTLSFCSSQMQRGSTATRRRQ